MRTLFFLIMATLCFNFTTEVKGQLLNKKVTVQYKNVTIEQVLKDITKLYHVNFSYSSNFIPSSKKVTIHLKDKPLSAVLSELLKGSEVSFEEVGSQVVLKKNEKKEGSKNNPSAKEKSINAISEPSTDTLKSVESVESVQQDVVASTRDTYVPENNTTVFFDEPNLESKILTDSIDKQTLKRQFLEEKRKLREQYYAKLDSIDNSSNQKSERNLKHDFRKTMRKLHMELNTISDSLNERYFKHKDTLNQVEKKDSLNQVEKKETLDTGKYIYRPGQVTFVPPMGTNGLESPRCVNNVSFNVLAGINAGVEGVEIGSLVNIEKDYAVGAQIAGLGNVVKNNVTGGQVSGLFNISGGHVQGTQISGFMNMTRGNAHVFQAAGFMNMTGKNCEGGQFAGFTNIAYGRMNGAQAAGFTNVAKDNVTGTQIAGFMNVAGDDVKGVQIAGFMNVAPDTLEGTQVAGFMNVAGKVKGSQIGFFNYADSVSGVQIGFLSFARKGYRRLELWGSESLYGNVAFKTGTHHFYNILAGGVSPKNNVLTYGFGYGFGGEVKLTNRMLMNIDAICFNIHQDGFSWNELNLLNQVRLNLGVRVGERTAIFLGPSLNVSVSNHYNTDTGRYGLALVPDWKFFSKTYSNNNNVAMWIGYNAGIRF